MTNDVVFFLPTRSGSQRVKNKNTRPFADFKGGILELKLRQLLLSKRISRVLLSTNDEVSVNIARRLDPSEKKITVVIRPDFLCLDSTNLTDLVRYVPEIIYSGHILWGHVTSPFVDDKDYDAAIDTYFEMREKGFDSLVSGLSFQNFLFDMAGNMVNNQTNLKWPRTQDLSPLFELNHAIFLASRKIYVEKQNRVGDTPFLYRMGKLKSIDIDCEEDFGIAEALYDKIVEV